MAMILEETQVSIAAVSRFPGFRFLPTDDELISYYLRKKLDGFGQCVEVIAEIRICDQEPWEMPVLVYLQPAKSVIQSDNEWFFFSPRGRKYPNGSQSKRATVHGYWKATGKDRDIKFGANVIGTKRTLVFHLGRAPKGERTEWIMHEYCMKDKSEDSMAVYRLRKNNEFRLHGNPNRSSLSQRHVSDRHSSDYANPDHNTGLMENYVSVDGKADGNNDNTDRSGEDKARECCSEECEGNYSPSIKQNGLASEPHHNVSDGFTRTDSSPQTGSGNIEDCYAEILKDDIIKLDVASSLHEPDSQQMMARESTIAKGIPLQGTANRRIRLQMTESQNFVPKTLGCSSKGRYDSNKTECGNYKESPKCSIDIFLLISLSLVILTFLVYFCLHLK